MATIRMILDPYLIRDCPICGSKAELHNYCDEDQPDLDIQFWVQCLSCKFGGWTSSNFEKAIDTWNENKLCSFCEKLDETVERRHRYTAYLKEEENYIVSCLECYQRDVEDCEEKWKEYYREVWQAVWCTGNDFGVR